MIHCATCGLPIDIDALDNYSVHFVVGEIPRYTCGECTDDETESTAIATVSEFDLTEG